MQLSLLKSLSLSDLKKSDEKLVYFLAYLYAISTGETDTTDLVKTASNSDYGNYSTAFRDAYRLGVGWTFGMAKSIEMVAMKVSSELGNPLKQLLVKFAQVVRLGDKLSTFFRAELTSSLLTYAIEYERKLEMQKLFLEMFYTLMSTAAFMIAANSIMTMLTGSNSSELILVYSLIGVTVSMSMFVFIMYMLFPRDKLAFSREDVDLKFRIKVYVSIGAGTGIGIVLLISQALPLSLVVGISLAPLFYPGLLARKMEQRIKKINQWYPEFIRHFGEILATVGSMGQSLDAVLRSDFGPIQKFVISLKNRIKINELRAKREQTSKTFESIIIVLHVLTLGVFGLMNKLTSIFFELISTVDISNNAFPLSPIDPAFMDMILPVMILMTSVISSIALKVAQGGLYKTVFYHIALLGVLGSITTFAMNVLMSDYLESSILDFGDVGV